MPWMLDRVRVAVRGVATRRVHASALLMLVVVFSATACLSDDGDEADPTVSPGSPMVDAVEPTVTDEVEAEVTPTVGDLTPTAVDSGPTARATASDGAATPDSGDGSPVAILRGPGVTIDELNADVDAFTGERVVVHGEVLEVLGERAFTIVDNAETVLVIGADGVTLTELAPGTFVRAAGAVRTFDVASLEAELGTTFDDTALGRFEGEPVLIADSVQVGPARVSNAISDLEIVQEQVIGVIGEIGEVVGPRAFVLREPVSSAEDASLLVVTPYLAVPGDRAEGSWVQAIGTVQTLDTSDPTALGDAYGFLSDSEYEEFDGQPVLVAELVEVVAPSATASVDDVVSGGDELVGQSVVLREVVTEIVGDRAFILGEDGGLLVVVAAGEVPPGFSEGALVVVDGVVTRFDPASPPVVDPAGGVDWNDDAIEAFAGELIVLTRSVVVIAPE